MQVSKDGVTWTTLYTHVDDCSLNEPGSTHTWTIQPPPDEKVRQRLVSFTYTLVVIIVYVNNNYYSEEILHQTSWIDLHLCLNLQTGWRHVRIQQTGKNASGQTHYLSLSGLELYGVVTGVCEDLGRAAKEAEANLRRQRRLVKSQVRRFS